MKVGLTVAGSDPSGGAGVQADIRVFSLFGIYSTSVITSLTVQNTLGVKESFPVSGEIFKQQLQTLLEDIKPNVLKVGMLQTSENVQILSEFIRRYDIRLNVVDTIIRSKNGFPLLDSHAVEMFKRYLIPMSFVLTPNIDEAQVLTGIQISTLEDIKRSCIDIHNMGAKYVIIKGGHFEYKDKVIDTLYDGKDFYLIETPRVNTENTHGTGCTFATALASNLAKGKDVYTSFHIAKAFVYASLSGSVEIGKGRGPLNHLWLYGT